VTLPADVPNTTELAGRASRPQVRDGLS